MVAAVLGWAAVVYVKVGHFTMSTQSGLSLVNHSIFFIEDAPARYAQVRDILLEYRAKRIAEVGHPGNTMWSALPAIREATGWSLPEASRELQKMSVQMFLQHPLRYAISVASAWLEFWTVPAMWIAPSLDRLWWVEHKLLRLANLAFALAGVWSCRVAAVSRGAALGPRHDGHRRNDPRLVPSAGAGRTRGRFALWHHQPVSDRACGHGRRIACPRAPSVAPH